MATTSSLVDPQHLDTTHPTDPPSLQTRVGGPFYMTTVTTHPQPHPRSKRESVGLFLYDYIGISNVRARMMTTWQHHGPGTPPLLQTRVGRAVFYALRQRQHAHTSWRRVRAQDMSCLKPQVFFYVFYVSFTHYDMFYMYYQHLGMEKSPNDGL